MKHFLKKEKKYSYIEYGEGKPIVVLHGLMGGLSNFDAVLHYFGDKGYKVIIKICYYFIHISKRPFRWFR